MAIHAELDAFIDESIKLSISKGYYPTVFIGMRQKWGTKEAIKRLVVSGDVQSGFRKLQKLKLLEWSIEAAVLKFPSDFEKGVQEAAQFRINQAALG